jgi:hypothetical protein
MPELKVSPACDFAGNSLDVAPTAAAFTIYRQVVGDDVISPIRGLVDITDSVLTTIIDIEVPLDKPVRYYMLQNATTPVNFTTATSRFYVDSEPLQNTCGFSQVLRDLYSPTIDFTTQFCLGTIDQTQFGVRAGVFPVLGRRSPVVAIDDSDTMGGTIIFIAQNELELEALRKMFADPDPMLLQTVGYNFGANGVLFFQPLTITEKWLPDGRIPQHVFEVEYVEVMSPPLSVVFSRALTTYDTLDDLYSSYTEIISTGSTYSDILA